MLKLTDDRLCGMSKAGLKHYEILLYKWLYNRYRRQIGKKIVLFYRDYIKWFKSHAAKSKKVESKKKEPISDRHLRRVVDNLAEAGFLEVKAERYGCLEIILFDLDFVLGLKTEDWTELPGHQKSQDEEPVIAKDQKAATKAGIQQQLIKCKELITTQLGINYRLEKDWWEIASHGLQKIEDTIELFKYRLLKNLKIENPAGWFRQALRDNYYLDFSPPMGLGYLVENWKNPPNKNSTATDVQNIIQAP